MSPVAMTRPGGTSVSGGASFGGGARAWRKMVVSIPVEITAAHNVTSAAAATAMVEVVLTNGRRLRGSDGLSPTGSDGPSPTGLAQLIRVPESA